MVKNYIQAIANKIAELFDHEYTIYTEQEEQGLKEPCFFIFSVTSLHGQVRGKVYHRTQPFAIHYLTTSKEAEEECNRVLDTLFWGLEYIDCNGLKRGTSMSGEYAGDGVAHFLVNYNVLLRLQDEINPMEENKLEIHVEE